MTGCTQRLESSPLPVFGSEENESSDDPIVLTSTIQNITSTPTWNAVVFTWENPETPTFAAMHLVASTNAYPSTVEDGDLVCTGELITCTDESVDPADTMYYSFFQENDTGDIELISTQSAVANGIITYATGTIYANGARFSDGYLYYSRSDDFYRLPFNKSTESFGSEETLASPGYNINDMIRHSNTEWIFSDTDNDAIKRVTFTDNTFTTIDTTNTEISGVSDIQGIATINTDIAYTVNSDNTIRFRDSADEHTIGGSLRFRGMDVYDGKIYVCDKGSSTLGIQIFDMQTEQFTLVGNSNFSGLSVQPVAVEVDSRYIYAVGNPSNKLIILDHSGNFVGSITVPSSFTIEMASSDDGYVFVSTTDSRYYLIRVWQE